MRIIGLVVLAFALLSGVGAYAAPAEQDQPPPIIQVGESAVLGQVLVDQDGRTLYTSSLDQPNESTCDDACAAIWPPLLVGEGDPALSPAAGLLQAMPRGDGFQVTFLGAPLYSYSGDAGPGDANGEGVDGIWHAARPALAANGGGATPEPPAVAAALPSATPTVVASPERSIDAAPPTATSTPAEPPAVAATPVEVASLTLTRSPTATLFPISLPVATVAPSPTPGFDGTWSGTTAQGDAVFFTVAGTHVTNVRINLAIKGVGPRGEPCSGRSELTAYAIDIANGAFFSGIYEGNANTVIGRFDGRFNSPTSASGAFSYGNTTVTGASCTYSVSTGWTARR